MPRLAKFLHFKITTRQKVRTQLIYLVVFVGVLGTACAWLFFMQGEATYYDQQVITVWNDAVEQISQDLAKGRQTEREYYRLGCRFVGISIPAGATITHAYLELKASKDGVQIPSKVLISAEDRASPPAFSHSEGSLFDRRRTDIRIAWHLSAWTKNNVYQSPDFSALIQEQVHKQGGLQHASLVLILSSEAKHLMDIYQYEDEAAFAPRLVLTYANPLSSK